MEFPQFLTAIARKTKYVLCTKISVVIENQEFEQHKSDILFLAHLDLKIRLADYLQALKTQPQA